ncbi:hypothetical protein [Sphaerotilus mobilis]|uniref:Uncharacterized protein n=1 Tax=Sphaerotilus mobilis TaxID=47994 RepID=A0A4Q7LRY6_9BURK|nr:hypothetical protein [Sphaerotilus mobilis]RZS56977.1 hypothetical protein EV685_1535 [Sphaerotilus mobilis]
MLLVSGCGGGGNAGSPATGDPPLVAAQRAWLVLLGDARTPAAQAATQALEDAGHATLWPAGGAPSRDELHAAIDARCGATAPPSDTFGPYGPSDPSGRAAIPCDALVLIGHGPSGAAQVDALARAWQPGSRGSPGWRVRAVLTVDAGYLPPGRVMDGVWQRSDLADTTRWQVGMIQSRDDPHASRCDADGCGVLPLAVAHGARSQPVLSACPHAGPAGEHRPTTALPDWISWQVDAVAALLRASRDAAAQPLVNACLDDLERERPRPPGPPPLR